MLTIHNNCKTKLKSEVKDILNKVQITNYNVNIIDFFDFSKLDTTFPTAVKEKLQSYIKEELMFSYMYEKVIDFVLTSSELDNYIDDSGFVKLSDYVNTEEFSNHIIDDLETFPHSGCIIVSLGKGITPFEGNNTLEISDEISLIQPDNSLEDLYPLTSGYERKDRVIHNENELMIPTEKKWCKDETYLKIEFSGFAGIHMITAPVDNAIDLYKSFLGFLIAMENVKIGYTPFKKNKYYTYSNNDGWKIENCKHFGTDMSKTLNKLSFNSDGLINMFNSEAFTESIALISQVIHKKEEAEKLLLAACWLFDSYCGENELLSFIQTTVSLEILLGEKETSDIMGLGALLRNRCAYLLGNSHKEREHILKDFQEIYDIRSKIVHRGKSKLSKYEKEMFRKLQALAKKVIKKEIELFTKQE